MIRYQNSRAARRSGAPAGSAFAGCRWFPCLVLAACWLMACMSARSEPPRRGRPVVRLAGESAANRPSSPATPRRGRPIVRLAGARSVVLRQGDAIATDDPAVDGAELPAPANEIEADQPEDSEAQVDSAASEEASSDEVATDEEAIQIPVATQDDGEVRIDGEGELVTLLARDAPLNTIVSMLAEHYGLNVVCAENITARVSITLTDVPLENALTAILSVAGYSWFRKDGIIMVTDVTSAASLPGAAQGKLLRVFDLDYASAADLAITVTGLLSPIGKSYVNQTSKTDNRKTRESIVVEDLPYVLQAVESYIAQVDQPPRQVLIEARVLRVDLSKENRHGVNWDYLFNPGRNIHISTTGFASPTAPQAFFASIDGNDLDALLECLETTTDAKTLAAPKVLVVNGQEAKFQVGGQLGFRVTTTTQTSTLQSVNFLDVGVVLRVTPHIGKDNQVLMHVQPEVSTGTINPDTELPESEITLVETDILLADGQGMVIGGLIDEEDRLVQSKIPLLGDLWFVGKLFQKGTMVRERSEVIIVLLPRIVPFDPVYQEQECLEYDRAMTPLFEGPLCPTPREFEPSLPDPDANPRTIFGKPVRKKQARRR